MVEIVIAEDSTAQAIFLKQALEENGYSVRRGRNGQEALDLIRETKPTLVISDIEMPVMDGYELCRAIKGDESLRDLPVVLLSTLSDAGDIILGLQAGADNYLTKPYGVPFLLARVEGLISQTTQLGSGQANNHHQLEVTLDGKLHKISSDSQQILNLLISTFENAVQKNGELIRANQQLTTAQAELKRNNNQLESLNGELTTANDRMRRDLDAAAKAQQALLPQKLPEVEGVKLAWQYRPCDELAGDILNVFMLDGNHLGLYVLDVSGHGVPASLLSVTLNRVIIPGSGESLLMRQDAGVLQPTSPVEVAEQLNARFPMDEANEKFFTLLYGVLNLETRELRYVCAGHPPPYRTAGEIAPEELEGEGLPIGIVEDATFDEYSVILKPGDRLFLFSDGVAEAMNANDDLFDAERIVSSLSKGRASTLEDSIQTLMSDVDAWISGSGATDDISVLALEIPHS